MQSGCVFFPPTISWLAAPRWLGLVGPAVLLARPAHHDQTLAKLQLRVLDPTSLALDLESHGEAKRSAEPVDRLGRLSVEDGRRDTRPSGWWLFHRGLLSI